MDVKDELIKELVTELVSEKEPDIVFDIGAIYTTNNFAIFVDEIGNVEIYEDMDSLIGDGMIYDAIQVLMEKLTKCREGTKAKKPGYITYYDLDKEAVILENTKAGTRKLLLEVYETQLTL